MNNHKAYLEAAANAVEKQAVENPGIGIPVDKEVAEHMGIFGEDAVSEQEVLDACEESVG